MYLKSTTDIWFASYVMLFGHEVRDYEIMNRNKGKFLFDISDADWKQLRLKFSTSDVSRIKMNQIILKDLLH